MGRDDWDGINPPIIKHDYTAVITKGSLLWQAFCCKERPGPEVAKLANEYHHPGTTNGWTWPSDRDFKLWCEANNEKWGSDFSVKELREGIPCVKLKGYKHYLLVM